MFKIYKILQSSGYTRVVRNCRLFSIATADINSPSSFKLKTLTTEAGIERRSVKSILESGESNEQVRIQGWIRGLRKQKANVFIDVDDGSTWNRLPIVLRAKDKPPDITLYSSIDVTGILVPTPKNPNLLELHPNSPITILGSCDQKQYPLGGKIRYDRDHLRKYPHLRFKSSKFASLLRLRSATATAIHDFFKENDFIQIHTPILTGNDCEGAGEAFLVKPMNHKLIEDIKRKSLAVDATDAKDKKSVDPEEVFFDAKTFLTVSSQLHLEAAVGGLGRVWTMSPVFRAENQQSTRHLSEFYMVEAEIAFAYEIEDILSIMESLVKFCIRRVIFDEFSEWDFCCEENLDFKNLLIQIWNKPFTIITFDEARKLLQEKADSLVPEGQGLNREQELLLVEKINDNTPVFLINWPKEIKPFYMRGCLDDSNLVSAVDLLIPEVGELCGGSLRENDLTILESKIMGMDPSGKMIDSMSWYCDIRHFGGVPSGGFGMGFDRLLQFLLSRGNIKDVSPFPRWPHNCPM